MYNVMLVEDNQFFRQSFRDFLKNRFPEIMINEASDSIEALQKVNEEQPDLIFMDINLPGVNGLSLGNMIKKSFPSLPIIILTAYDLAEYREAAIGFGADEYLVKAAMNCAEIEELVKSRLGDNISSVRNSAADDE
jgi:two-component system, response regulator YesN